MGRLLLLVMITMERLQRSGLYAAVAVAQQRFRGVVTLGSRGSYMWHRWVTEFKV